MVDNFWIFKIVGPRYVVPQYVESWFVTVRCGMDTAVDYGYCQRVRQKMRDPESGNRQ